MTLENLNQLIYQAPCLDPLCKALSITFEHPTEEVIATAELDLSSVVAPRCRVYSSSVALCPEETADRVLQVISNKRQAIPRQFILIPCAG